MWFFRLSVLGSTNSKLIITGFLSSGGNGFIVNATSKVPLSVGILLPSCAKARGTAAKIIMAAHNASLLTIPMPNDYTIEKLVDKSVPISLNYLDI